MPSKPILTAVVMQLKGGENKHLLNPAAPSVLKFLSIRTQVPFLSPCESRESFPWPLLVEPCSLNESWLHRVFKYSKNTASGQSRKGCSRTDYWFWDKLLDDNNELPTPVLSTGLDLPLTPVPCALRGLYQDWHLHSLWLGPGLKA